MEPESDVVQEQVGPGRTLLRPCGELDIASTPRLKAALVAAVDAGAIGVVVDLTAVTFVDSSGFTALLLGAKRLAQRNGQLALVTTNPSVIRTLAMMELTKVLPPFATREEALASLRGLER